MRTQESLKLLNFGFRFFDTVRLYEANQSISQFRIWQGETEQVKVGFAKDFVLSLPKGQAEKLKVSYNFV